LCASQVHVEAEPPCPTAGSCRLRADVCVWNPDRASSEGVDVNAFLAASHKLYAAAGKPRDFAADVRPQGFEPRCNRRPGVTATRCNRWRNRHCTGWAPTQWGRRDSNL
jgi:hypothetical protein